MRSPLLTLSLARPRYNAEAILKSVELSVYANSRDILAHAVNFILKKSFYYQHLVLLLGMTYGRVHT